MIPVFDAHADTLTQLYDSGGSLWENGGQFDLYRTESHRPSAQFFAICMRDFDSVFPFIEKTFRENSGRAALCRTAREARAAGGCGLLAAFLSLEGGEAIGCDPERLDAAYRRGVRMAGLTWNHDNPLAGGAGGEGGKGLTALGRAYLSKLKSLSILVDVSHLSDRSFWDVAEAMGRTAFVASHSNARAVCGHKRNLTDEQFLAIVRANGFAGINLYVPFLTECGRASWDDVGAHIEHFAALGGAMHISLGCDFDGCETLPDGVRGAQDIETLYEWLLAKNYSEDMVRDIFYNNIMRVVEQVCDT